jgi:hypothetical protein
MYLITQPSFPRNKITIEANYTIYATTKYPLLIITVERKRPSKWTSVGKQMVMRELLEYAESRFVLTQYEAMSVGWDRLTLEGVQD